MLGVKRQPAHRRHETLHRWHRTPRANFCICRAPSQGAQAAETTTGSAASFRLPNGLVLRHFTADELNFLYREVYEDRVYLRHGVTLRPGDIIVDVGANTGLFTLLAAQEVGPAGRVVALEPLGRTFQLLRENVEAHATWCRGRGVETCSPVLLNCGAGAPGQEAATFVTYSASASGWSTMYPDDSEVAANMTAYILNLMEGPGPGRDAARGGDVDGEDGGGGVAVQRPAPEPALAGLARTLWRLPPLRPLLRASASAYVAAMLGGQRRWSCRLVPLREVIREQGLARVDLLKVDVERAELDVLAGLAEEDWPLVRQVAMEVHDLGGRLELVRRELAARGFSRVVVAQDPNLAGSSIHLVYAVR